MMDKDNSGVCKNCNNHIREKLLELLGTNARCPKEVSNCYDCPYWADDVGCYEDGAVADMLIANGVTIQQWIPVTERLPEKNTVNIVVDQYGIVFQCLYAYYGWDLWEGNKVVITHWMPMPEVPKGE